MDFYKDLLKKDKSKPQIIMGLFLIALSVSWFLTIAYHQETIKVFNWIYCIFLIFHGIIQIIEGSGTSIDNFFGKAFININSDKIQIKVKVLKPEIYIAWADIKNVNFKTTEIKFQKTDNSDLIIKYNILGYELTQKVKDIISKIAQEKNIEIQTI